MRTPSFTRPSTVLLAAASLAGLGASFAVTGPAAAVPISGVVRAELESPDNAVDKSVIVACPAGKKVINAGGYITAGNGSVAMDDIYPDETLSTVKVSGRETDPIATNWRVKGFATCADEPAGLEWVWERSDDDTDDAKSVTARCPEGKTLLGTGGTLVGGNGEVIIDEIKPDGGPGVAPTEVTVQAAEADAFTGSWRVNALAICAEPLDGQQRISAQTAPASVNDGVRADCPAGQVATGSGAEIVGPTGEVVLDDSYPTNGSTVDPPTATTVYGQEEDATAADWFIRGFVICADD
ncbi:MAG TPA: hypothetical protein VES42_00435 [Pilimelia sp.]|nr:hypothetical protein [Pilimelia sp.]